MNYFLKINKPTVSKADASACIESFTEHSDNLVRAEDKQVHASCKPLAKNHATTLSATVITLSNRFNALSVDEDVIQERSVENISLLSASNALQSKHRTLDHLPKILASNSTNGQKVNVLA